jgi:hypothetical protein
MNDDLLIVGITRFSVVTATSMKNFTATARLDLDQTRQLIWSAPRMLRRFVLFDRLMLKSVDRNLARRYPLYRHIILISKEMPWVWKVRLAWSLRGKPWCQVLALDAHEKASERITETLRATGHKGRLFTFRIDDDDAIADIYLDTLLSTQAPEGTVLSVANGFNLSWRDGDLVVQPKYGPRIALGIGVFSTIERLQHVHELGNHTKIHDRFPTIIVEDTGPFWLRTMHDTNGSLAKMRPQVVVAPVAEHEALIAERFGLSAADLLTAMPRASALQAGTRSASRAVLR